MSFLTFLLSWTCVLQKTCDRNDGDAGLFEGDRGICAGSIGGWDWKQKLRRTRSANGARRRRTALRLLLRSKRSDAKEKLVPMWIAREKRPQQGQSQNQRETPRWTRTTIGTVVRNRVIGIRMQTGERIRLTFPGDGCLNKKVYLSQPRAAKATCRLIIPARLRLS